MRPCPQEPTINSAVWPGTIYSNLTIHKYSHTAPGFSSPALPLPFQPPPSDANTILLAKLSTHKNLVMWSHALVMFNALGLQLAQGAYLEWNYTTAFPEKDLVSVVAVVATGWGCILCSPFIVVSIYNLSNWRKQKKQSETSSSQTKQAQPQRKQEQVPPISTQEKSKSLHIFTTLLLFTSQIALHWLKSFTCILVLQGIVIPSGLSLLATLSTIRLAKHYKHNIPLVSMQAFTPGFLGGAIYTTIARQGLKVRGGYAQGASAGVMLCTLVLAWWMIPPSLPLSLPLLPLPSSSSHLYLRHRHRRNPKTRPQNKAKSLSNLLLTISYLLLISAILIPLTFTSLLLTQPPTLLPPSTSTLTLIATLLSASLSACLAPHPRITRSINPINAFSLAGILSASAILVLFYQPANQWVVFGASGVYGVCLGVVLVAQGVVVSSVYGSEGRK